MSTVTGRTLRVDNAHPSLAGHFPGSPIVPGVVLLSYVLTELKRWRPGTEVASVKKLKFLHLVLPEMDFSVEFSPLAENGLRFRCRSRTELLVEGHLQLQTGPNAAFVGVRGAAGS